MLSFQGGLGTGINIVPKKVNLGNVEYNGYYKFNFKIVNKSNSPVVIKNVIGDCGCVSFEFSKNKILQGESMVIYGLQKIVDTFDFNKSIIVYTSSNIKPFLTLELNGYVINNSK